MNAPCLRMCLRIAFPAVAMISGCGGGSSPSQPPPAATPARPDGAPNLPVPASAAILRLAQRYQEEPRATSAKVSAAERASTNLGNRSTLEVTVPAEGAGTLQRDFNDQYDQYRLQEVDAYLRLTSDTGDAKTAGDRFLRTYFAAIADKPDAPERQTVLELGQAALDAGSTDPLLRTYQGFYTNSRGGDPYRFRDLLLESSQTLRESDYPPIVNVFAQTWIHELPDNQARTSKFRFKDYVAVIVRWLEWETDRPRWRRCAYRRFLTIWNSLSTQQQDQLLEGCLQARQIDPWLIHNLLGAYYIRLGWQYRGTEFADKVEPEQWQQFHQCLDLAALHLRCAWTIDPTAPEAPTQMITVAMAGDHFGQDPYDWFVRAIDAQFDHDAAYQSLWYALRPRWGGSISDMLTFGEQCLRTDRFDTCVPYLLIEILDEVDQKELRPQSSLRELPRARQLLRRFLTLRSNWRHAHPVQPLLGDEAYYRTRLGLLLLTCGFESQALTEFRAAGDDVDFVFLRDRFPLGAYQLARVCAEQEGALPRVQKLDELLRSQWDAHGGPETVERTRRELQELRRTASHPRALLFYRHAERMLDELAAYSNHEWVELGFEQDFPGWEIDASDVSLEPETGAVRISCRNAGTSQLHARLLAGFKPPFVVEAEVECLEPYPYPFPVGIHWCRDGLSSADDWDDRQPLFGVDSHLSSPEFESRRDDRAVISLGKLNPVADQYWLKHQGPHQLRLRMWEREYEVTTDGVIKSGTLPRGLDSAGVLGIGEVVPESEWRDRADHAGEIRISAVRIQRLDQEPPPGATAAPEVRSAYWQSRLLADPHDPFALLQIGELRLQDGQYAEAETEAMQALEYEPRVNGAHTICGLVDFHTGDYAAAITHLRQAKDEPGDDARIYVALAMILAAAPDDALRSGRGAHENARIAVRLTGSKDAVALAALAAAHAELGEFEEARKSNSLAINEAAPPLDSQLKVRQELYASAKPFRLSP